jgi:hypothetical protein
MAIIRTVLPRKGIIQPRHGDNYEADLDTNWQLIDSLLQDAADVQAAVQTAGTVAAWLNDLTLSGVISGFDLSASATLIPALTPGILYAQGARYAPGSITLNPAPANSTSYLWWNAVTGFVYGLTGLPPHQGDAYLGCLTTDSSHITSAECSTKIYGQVQVSAASPGNFSLPHKLGRTPLGALVYPTSPGSVWFQLATQFDATNLYLVASDSDVTAKVQIW